MQEMDYQGGYRDEPPVAPVYQGTPPQYNTYTSGPAGQKLSGFAHSNVTGNGPSAGQRLALALVSLILWMGFFMGIIFSVVAIASRDDSINFSMRIFIILMLVSGMLIFTGLVIFINALFNRNKR